MIAVLCLGAVLLHRPKHWTLAEFAAAEKDRISSVQEEAAALAEIHDPDAEIAFVTALPILGGSAERHSVVTNSRKLYDAWLQRTPRGD